MKQNSTYADISIKEPNFYLYVLNGTILLCSTFVRAKYVKRRLNGSKRCFLIAYHNILNFIVSDSRESI